MTKPASSTRLIAAWTGIGLVFVIACVLRLAVGSASLGLPDPGSELGREVLEARSIRLLAGCIVGAGLAVAGVALQALLRNALAEPFILGLSTGAGLGVIAQLMITHALGDAGIGTEIGALVGAMASMAIVLAAGQKRGVVDPLGLLLTGVVLSTINGAIIVLLNYLAGPGGLKEEFSRWMMGYISDSTSITRLIICAGLTLGIIAGLMLQSRALNISTLADDEARSLGVNVRLLRFFLFVSSGTLAAMAVVIAGPISFVGLICPHLARLALGPDHGKVIPAAALLGASLIVMSDTASAAIGYGMQIGLVPLGIFTAIIGGVSFLWMLRPQLGRE